MRAKIRQVLILKWLFVLALGLSPLRSALANVRVVATVPSLAAIVREVGGTCVEVTSLAQASEDPHFVDGRPSFIVSLNRAQLLVAVGLDLEEDWLPTLVVSARNGAIVAGSNGYVEVAQFVDLLEPQPGKVDRAMGDIHPGGNPHFLFAPKPVAQIALGLKHTLAEIDPEHKDVFARRAEAFCSRISLVEKEQRARFASLSAARRKVVTYHRSMAYVLDWLGLTEVQTLEPKPGVQPNPAHVAQVLRAMRREKVAAIVQEEFYPEKTSKTLARLAPAKFVSLPGGLRFGRNETFETHFTSVANAIYDGLHD